MGCITSKHSVSVSPSLHYPASIFDHGSGILHQPPLQSSIASHKQVKKVESEELRRERISNSISIRMEDSYESVRKNARSVWPSWLSAAAGDVIQGLVPLSSDSFEMLEKIGQGTYSRVYRARNVETGKMVALKKVHFDNIHADSVRFMAREIRILRKLDDHPNIIKLEGIVISPSSSNIYLVFDYMEHDLTGLLSSPDIKFTDPQIKCYMKQLLSGLEHCHSRGIMHRDIKTSNLLVNNEGILKVADFGLSAAFGSTCTQPLTSRVVTLWYRPPELILGSTNYGPYVDLWSVGCVFAELLFGKPLLKGKTEVEQLHNIFKLCGSPSDEYWKKSKLPHATMFKPQRPYQSCLRERCKELPMTAIKLIESLLSLEPDKRGTASSALDSQYFITEPYACDPSSLPKYTPTKEIDAKSREYTQRKKAGLNHGMTGNPRRHSKVLQEPDSVNRFAPTKDLQGNTKHAHRTTSSISHAPNLRKSSCYVESRKASLGAMSEMSRLTNASHSDIVFLNPSSTHFSTSNQKDNNAYIRRPRSLSRKNKILNTERQLNEDSQYGSRMNYSRRRSRAQCSFDASDDFRLENDYMVVEDEAIQFSGLLSSQSKRTDEIIHKKERYINEGIRRSRLQRGTVT